MSVELSSRLISIESKSDIRCSVYKSGWAALVHHLETVAGSLPNCSASHLPVCPVSANTAFIRFNFNRSVFVSMIDLLNLNANIAITFELTMGTCCIT